MQKIKKCKKCNKIAEITKTINDEKDIYSFVCGCGNKGTQVFCDMTKESAIIHYNASIPDDKDIIITIKIADGRIIISGPPIKSDEEWEYVKETIEAHRNNILGAVKTFAI